MKPSKDGASVGGQALSPPDASPPRAVVGVGASAGGLQACRNFLHALQPSTGMAFVLITHLDPNHPSMMAELLAKDSPIPVLTAQEGVFLQPDHFYVMPPGVFVSIEGGIIHLVPPNQPHGARLPVDFFLRALAGSEAGRAIAVILSGTGADGSAGVRAIKRRAGHVIAQDPSEAEFAGMPESAVATGKVDQVLPLAEIGRALAAWTLAQPGSVLRPDAQPPPAPEPTNPETADTQDNEDAAAPEWVADVTACLAALAPYDFSAYKPGTLGRRISRRMDLTGCASATAYMDLLERSSAEVKALIDALLINVTSFFRDPAAFAALRDKILPKKLAQRAAGDAFRIWVAGCSSGEEAYSIAMTIDAVIGASGKRIPIQIFASDADASAVNTAREGFYGKQIEADIPADMLDRYFAWDDGGWRVSPALRSMVVFSTHNLLRDVPFPSLDLVSCRNVLIYLLPEAQRHLLGLFHFALKADGVLFLGSAETARAFEEGFRPLSKSKSFYQRQEAPRITGRLPDVFKGWNPAGHWHSSRQPLGPIAARLLEATPQFQPDATRAAAEADPTARRGIADIARLTATRAFAPASVLTNAAGDVLFSMGPRSPFLGLPSGEPTNNVIEMVVAGLRRELSDVMAQALSAMSVVTLNDLSVPGDAIGRGVTLRLEPVRHGSETLLLISFQEMDLAQPQPSSTPPTEAELSAIGKLQRENRALVQELASVNREVMNTREQGRLVSEQAMSVNEEFQSINEELATSKEELQSLNEELTALNSQLQETLSRQRQTAEDLQNILDGSSIATLFLDSQLKIRLFTPSAQSLFNFIANDVGRPLADLAALVVDPDLLADAGTVLNMLQPMGREVAGPAGKWFMRRIRPYMDTQKQLSGVIITFADISEMRAASDALKAARVHSDQIVQATRQPLVVLDGQLVILDANEAFLRLFATEIEADAASPTADADGNEARLKVGHDALEALLTGLPRLKAFLSATDAGAGPSMEVSTEALLPGGWRSLTLTACRIDKNLSHNRETLLCIEDVTVRDQVAAGLDAARAKAEHANRGKSRFLAAASHDLRQPLQSMSMLLGVLAAKTDQNDVLKVITRLDTTVGAMSGILDALLDINQLEVGQVRVSLLDFSMDALLASLDEEFGRSARAIGLDWRVVPCHAVVRSDMRLLRQVLRNFISNALKYTRRGRILVGCRRMPDHIRIEVWDNGIGIPPNQQRLIFEEFHQIDNPAREGGRGLGLGLAITRRLANLLQHPLSVRSVDGKGSVFAIEVPISRGEQPHPPSTMDGPEGAPLILVVDNDTNVGEAVSMLLQEAGHLVMLANDGEQAIQMAAYHPPSLIIADQNLPRGITGIEVVERVRQAHRGRASGFLPAIILTGDTSAQTLRDIKSRQLDHAPKPVGAEDLLQRVKRLMPEPYVWDPSAISPGGRLGNIFIVDDDTEVRTNTASWLDSLGWTVEAYPSAEAFLASDHPARHGCVLIDAVMQGMDGISLLEKLRPHASRLASIVITGNFEARLAIAAITAGAKDFIEKPIERGHLLASIQRAMTTIDDLAGEALAQAGVQDRLRKLTQRQREILERVVGGQSSKVIAAGLKISTRTVENHRAAIMFRLGVRSLPELIRMVISARSSGGSTPDR